MAAAARSSSAASGTGLSLRRISREDLPHLIALDDDPEVTRYLNGGLPADRRHIEETVLPAFLATDPARPYLGVWAVETALPGAGGPGFLGWVSLRALDAGGPGTATLGFRFRRAAWGHGHATAAARTLLAEAFASGAVERIVATTYQDNLASQRVLARLGFALVRRFRFSDADLAASATHASATTVWEGDELEYELRAPL